MFAWMKMRSWIALVMPMTLTGLHALSVETPTTVSTGKPMLLDRADDVLRALDVGPDGFVREVLAGRHLLQRGGVDDDVGVAQRGSDAVRSRARRRCGTPAAARSCGR